MTLTIKSIGQGLSKPQTYFAGIHRYELRMAEGKGKREGIKIGRWQGIAIGSALATLFAFAIWGLFLRNHS